MAVLNSAPIETFGRRALGQLRSRTAVKRLFVPGCAFGWPSGRTGTMSPAPGDKKAEKSYLASAVDSINPWGGSRSSTPTPKDPQPKQEPPVNPGDHIVNPLYGQSFRRYPPDCPKLNVQWFHAVDVSTYLVDRFIVYMTDGLTGSPTARYQSESPSSERGNRPSMQTTRNNRRSRKSSLPSPRTTPSPSKPRIKRNWRKSKTDEHRPARLV